MKPKAYSYVRFSSPEQARGDSLRRQVELSEQYAIKHGLVLDDRLMLTDKGLSAYKGHHRTKGALGEFLKLVEQGQIPKGSVLIVENMDRLSRQQVLDALNQFTGIIQAGIRLVTLQDGMEYDLDSINQNWTQLIISITYMARAHEESEAKSKRLKASWTNKRHRASNGEIKLTSRAPAWLELIDKRFLIIAERAEAVRQIFEMKLSGKGVHHIEQAMNRQDGWKPKKGWRKSYINKILRNRSVIGEYQPHKMIDGKRQPVGEAIPDYFPAIIDKALFDRVQEQFKRNREIKGNAGGRNGKISNLFGHIAYCRYCNGPMAFVNKGPGPKGGQYLICDRARRGLDCHRYSIRYDQVEPLILEYCIGLDASQILPGNDKRQSELTELRSRCQAIDGELGQIGPKIDNLLDSISDTDSKELRKVLEDRANKILEQKQKLEADRQEVQTSIDDLISAGQETEQRLNSIRELFDFLGSAEGQDLIDVRASLRDQLRRLIDKIIIQADQNSMAVFFSTGERRSLTIGKGLGFTAYPVRRTG